MFREMRRKGQLLSEERVIEILKKETSGVLAVLGDEDYPYAVPVSYVYDNGKIYFHTATAGHKIDAMTKHDKVSFCIIEKDQIVPEEYTTYFRSVIAFGKARIIQDETEKMRTLQLLSEKYNPGDVGGTREKEINAGFAHLHMVALDIEHVTGKEAIELAKKRK